MNKLSKLKGKHNIDILMNGWMMIDLTFYLKSLVVQYSHTEKSPQSGPILTSVGYNIPIIASNLAGIREYLTDLEDSLLFISEDPVGKEKNLSLFYDF